MTVGDGRFLLQLEFENESRNANRLRGTRQARDRHKGAGMKTYSLTLESQPHDSFRCKKAANSLDIDMAKKLRHEFNVEADIESSFNVGLIVGASGSGKTTLAESIYGKDSLTRILDSSLPVIEQFPG